jgi:hypothetical protein
VSRRATQHGRWLVGIAAVLVLAVFAAAAVASAGSSALRDAGAFRAAVNKYKDALAKAESA